MRLIQIIKEKQQYSSQFEAVMTESSLKYWDAVYTQYNAPLSESGLQVSEKNIETMIVETAMQLPMDMWPAYTKVLEEGWAEWADTATDKLATFGRNVEKVKKDMISGGIKLFKGIIPKPLKELGAKMAAVVIQKLQVWMEKIGSVVKSVGEKLGIEAKEMCPTLENASQEYDDAFALNESDEIEITFAKSAKENGRVLTNAEAVAVDIVRAKMNGQEITGIQATEIAKVTLGAKDPAAATSLDDSSVLLEFFKKNKIKSLVKTIEKEQNGGVEDGASTDGIACSLPFAEKAIKAIEENQLFNQALDKLGIDPQTTFIPTLKAMVKTKGSLMMGISSVLLSFLTGAGAVSITIAIFGAALPAIAATIEKIAEEKGASEATLKRIKNFGDIAKLIGTVISIGNIINIGYKFFVDTPPPVAAAGVVAAGAKVNPAKVAEFKDALSANINISAEKFTALGKMSPETFEKFTSVVNSGRYSVAGQEELIRMMASSSKLGSINPETLSMVMGNAETKNALFTSIKDVKNLDTLLSKTPRDISNIESLFRDEITKGYGKANIGGMTNAYDKIVAAGFDPTKNFEIDKIAGTITQGGVVKNINPSEFLKAGVTSDLAGEASSAQAIAAEKFAASGKIADGLGFTGEGKANLLKALEQKKFSADAFKALSTENQTALLDGLKQGKIPTAQWEALKVAGGGNPAQVAKEVGETAKEKALRTGQAVEEVGETAKEKALRTGQDTVGLDTPKMDLSSAEYRNPIVIDPTNPDVAHQLATSKLSTAQAVSQKATLEIERISANADTIRLGGQNPDTLIATQQKLIDQATQSSTAATGTLSKVADIKAATLEMSASSSILNDTHVKGIMAKAASDSPLAEYVNKATAGTFKKTASLQQELKDTIAGNIESPRAISEITAELNTAVIKAKEVKESLGQTIMDNLRADMEGGIFNASSMTEIAQELYPDQDAEAVSRALTALFTSTDATTVASVNKITANYIAGTMTGPETQKAYSEALKAMQAGSAS